MGFGDWKTVKLELTQPYSIEELFHKIRDIPFEAGHPKLIRRGSVTVIAWPRIDRHNQIQIQGKDGKFRCLRSSRPADLEIVNRDTEFNFVLWFFSLFSGLCGPIKKYCEELAKKTGRQINALHL